VDNKKLIIITFAFKCSNIDILTAVLSPVILIPLAGSVIKSHCVLDRKKRFLITAVLKQAETDLTVPVHL